MNNTRKTDGFELKVKMHNETLKTQRHELSKGKWDILYLEHVAMGAMMQKGLCKQDDVDQQSLNNQEKRLSLLAYQSRCLSAQRAPPSGLAFCGCGFEGRSCICLKLKLASFS